MPGKVNPVMCESMMQLTARVMGNDQLTSIELARQQLGKYDASGRRRPEPIPGSEFTLDVDVLIPAIGQSPDLTCMEGEKGVETGRGSTFVVNEGLGTTREGVFAAGDAATGPVTVIQAVAQGNKVAAAVDHMLGYVLALDLTLRDIQSPRTTLATGDGSIDAERLHGEVSVTSDDGSITLSGCELDRGWVELGDGDLTVLESEGDFEIGILDILHDRLTGEDREVPGGAVEVGHQLLAGAEILFRGHHDGLLQRGDDDLGFDPLLPAHLFDYL